MIIGVTHDADGRVVERLPVSTKLAIGLPPNGERNYPTKLDHFVFLRKKRTTKGVEWEPDPELTDRYGTDCRAVRIVLIDDDIENVFPTSYAWWTAVERKCWGDGTQATRRTAEKPAGQPWRPCGSGCPELASGVCKPSGDLRFVLADFPRLGSVCRIHTSSYRSIRQIHSALQEIRSFTGGRLAGLTAKLVVRPEEAAYFDSKDHRKKSTTIWALSLEVDGRDMKKLVASLTENARVFVETRKLLAGGRVLEVVEDEAEEASEVAAEFYGAPEAAPAFSEKVSVTDHTAETTRALARGIEKTAVGTITGANASIPVTAAIDDPEPPQTPPWELEVDRAPATSQTPAGDTKPNGKASGSGAPPKTSRLRGIVGPLEPDAKGNTVRRNERGVEYVVFKISENGSRAQVFCNRPEL
ncbi:MAG: hypothetical protein ACRD2O_09760, partial [Terriglobia bacterium]